MGRDYGHHAYRKRDPVTSNIIYDIASITKVVASLHVLIYLTRQGQLGIKERFSSYPLSLKEANERFLRTNRILVHQARPTRLF